MFIDFIEAFLQPNLDDSSDTSTYEDGTLDLRTKNNTDEEDNYMMKDNIGDEEENIVDEDDYYRHQSVSEDVGLESRLEGKRMDSVNTEWTQET